MSEAEDRKQQLDSVVSKLSLKAEQSGMLKEIRTVLQFALEAKDINELKLKIIEESKRVSELVKDNG